MIYFIRSENSVKIGYVSNRRSIQSRLDSLQTGCPSVLSILGVMDGTRAMEGELHRRFEKDRTIGEWFRLSSQIVEFIEEECRPFVTRIDRPNAFLPSRQERAKPISIGSTISDQVLEFLQSCERSPDVMPARKVYEALLKHRKKMGHDGAKPSLRKMSSALMQMNFTRYVDRDKCSFYGIKIPETV